MLAIVLGLSASLAWGVADFLGGVESRRRAVLVVVLVSQGFGLAAMVAMVGLRATPFPGLGDLWPAAAGGLCGLVAILAFYRALAIGTISVVAPILSTSA